MRVFNTAYEDSRHPDAQNNVFLLVNQDEPDIFKGSIVLHIGRIYCRGQSQGRKYCLAVTMVTCH